MDFLEKARVRLEHWVEHSDHHIEDYTLFAEQLDQEGKTESASYIREMIELNQKSTECLKKALDALG
jgi:hypothetical protein